MLERERDDLCLNEVRFMQTSSSKPGSQVGCAWASRIRRSRLAFFRAYSGSGLVIHALSIH